MRTRDAFDCRARKHGVRSARINFFRALLQQGFCGFHQRSGRIDDIVEDQAGAAFDVADLLVTAGANRALFVDLHAAQIQGFFNIPVDHLFASPVLVGYFRDLNLPNLTVVSPDAGGVERARFFAKKMEVPLAIVDKRRTDINVTEVMNVIGDVKGRTCLILDDIVDTAGTLVKTAEALLEQGADKVYACASHAVLSGPAVERIASSRLEQLVVTNTIPLSEEASKVNKIKVLSIAGLLGRAIESIHMETSVSTLFN